MKLFLSILLISLAFSGNCEAGTSIPDMLQSPPFELTRFAGGGPADVHSLDCSAIVYKAPASVKATADPSVGVCGNIVVNKLVYSIFDWSAIEGNEPGTNYSATLIGWADSNDYYPDLSVPDWVRYKGHKVKVTTINDYAFTNGWGLKSLRLGKNIIYIGKSAFRSCMFPEVTIPRATAVIMNSAFFWSGLSKVTFASPHSRYPKLIIGPGAFSACLLTEFELPARATIYQNGSDSFWFGYDRGSFISCNPLDNVTIHPAYRNNAGGRADSGDYGDDETDENIYKEDPTDYDELNGLSFEIIGNSLCVVEKKDDCETVNVLTYPGESPTSSVEITAGEINVWPDAFHDVSHLSSITLKSTTSNPSAQMVVNTNAISGSSLKTINIETANGNLYLAPEFANGDAIESVSLGENSDYSIEDNVIYSDNGSTLLTYPGGKTATDFTVPDNVRRIENGAFAGNTNIVTVDLPAGLESIGNRAFKASTLRNLNHDGNALRQIGENAFEETPLLTAAGDIEAVWNGWLLDYRNTSPLQEIKLNDNITAIADGVFINEHALVSAELPSRLKIIPDNLFAACVSLKQIKWPTALTTIRFGAFQNTALEYINIPPGVTDIGAFAFANCHDVKTLALPASIKSIDSYAFFFTEGAPGEVIVKLSKAPAAQSMLPIFHDTTLSSSMLVIPEGVSPSSFTDSPLWAFDNVTNRNLDSISTVNDGGGAEIIFENGLIHARNNSPITVYSIDGKIIGHGTSAEVSQPGIYIIVSCGYVTKLAL